MVSKTPQSSRKTFVLIQEIIKLGTVNIPDEFQGNGAPGNTLESLLNLKQNNNDSPDLLDWEIKFHGGNSLLTLFHKDPQPKGIVDKMVDAFGWENEKGQISFRHTIKGRSNRGFFIKSVDNRIEVLNVNDPTIVPYWDHNIILNAIGSKLRRLILVHGKVSKDKRQVTYESAHAYWDLNLLGICEAIKEGTIYIDFDARTNEGKGTSIRNHGTKFRIHINNIGSIYQTSKKID